MKKIILTVVLFIFTVGLYSQEVNISDIKFKMLKTSSFRSTFENIRRDVYNLSYSSILPVNGIYKVRCTSTAKEAIIQIGYSMTNTPPDTLYISDDLFGFFTDGGKGSSPEVRLTFLGWSETAAKPENDFLNIQSLVIPPEKVYSKVTENGEDKFYIQLGSFSFYQNSYPKITQLLPYLELKPNFFMVEYKEKDNKVYRVLAGPYSREDAIKITRTINSNTKEPVYLQSGATIIKQDK